MTDLTMNDGADVVLYPRTWLRSNADGSTAALYVQPTQKHNVTLVDDKVPLSPRGFTAHRSSSHTMVVIQDHMHVFCYVLGDDGRRSKLSHCVDLPQDHSDEPMGITLIKRGTPDHNARSHDLYLLKLAGKGYVILSVYDSLYVKVVNSDYAHPVIGRVWWGWRESAIFQYGTTLCNVAPGGLEELYHDCNVVTMDTWIPRSNARSRNLFCYVLIEKLDESKGGGYQVVIIPEHGVTRREYAYVAAHLPDITEQPLLKQTAMGVPLIVSSSAGEVLLTFTGVDSDGWVLPGLLKMWDPPIE